LSDDPSYRTLKVKVLLRQENRCLNCAAEFSNDEPPHWHYSTPLKDGGERTFENTEAMCKDCFFEELRNRADNNRPTKDRGQRQIDSSKESLSADEFFWGKGNNANNSVNNVNEFFWGKRKKGNKNASDDVNKFFWG
jgi:hypothetical protein